MPEAAARRTPDPLESRGFAPRPRERFAFDTSVTGYSRYRHGPPRALPLSNLIWGDDPTHDAAGARAAGSDGAGGQRGAAAAGPCAGRAPRAGAAAADAAGDADAP